MKLVEIRDLDGPNLFLLEPAIKIEFCVSSIAFTAIHLEPLHQRLGLVRELNAVPDDPIEGLAAALRGGVRHLHARAHMPIPTVDWQPLETVDHFALVFGWTHRRAALHLARTLADAATGVGTLDEVAVAEIGKIASTTDPDDIPLMVRDRDRRIPLIGVTGTNGKTTTTRLIAHILRSAGLRVGWSSSAGVFIEGEMALEGDYTGPSGARRVLDDRGIDVAVLETARGGILLRGIAYESNDVSVFTNVSADHLDLQGVHSVEGLARVKSTVARITHPDGFAVLNADDELVRSSAAEVHARIFFVSQDPRNVAVDEHVEAGGLALIARDNRVWFWQDGQASRLVDVGEIPITYDGRARHMVENALCAAAACLSLGRTPAEVRAGLISFKSDAAHNMGRLNLFDVDGVRVVVDFAHNEIGLRHLLALARDLKVPGGRIISIIGTAGDRTDDALIGIGRAAGESSDRVIIKETKKYLRGRQDNEHLNALYVRGLKIAASASWSIEPTEMAALERALEVANPADVVVMMCLEQIPQVQQYLSERGRSL